MSVLAVAKHEFSVNVRRREFILLTLGFPLLMLVIFSSSVPMLSTAGDIKAGFVDNSGLLSANEIKEVVNTDGMKSSFKITLVRYPSEDAAKKDLINGLIDGYCIIDKNYLDNGRITGYTKKPSRNLAKILEKRLDKALLAGSSPEVIKRVVEGSNYVEYRVGRNGELQEQNFLNFIIPVAFATLLFVSILSSSSYLMQGIAEDKESRMMEILLSSIPAEKLLVGKLLGLGLLGLVQISVWIAVASPFAAGFVMISPFVFLLAFVYFILGYALYASLISCIAAISPTLKDAQQMLGIVILPVILSMVFGQVVVLNPSSPVSLLFSYLPFTSPVGMPLRYAGGQVEGYEIAVSLVLLAVFTIITAKIAAKLFSLYALSYTKPRIGDVVRSIRSVF